MREGWTDIAPDAGSGFMEGWGGLTVGDGGTQVIEGWGGTR